MTNPELERFFDLVCDRIAAHETYAASLEQAAASGATLVLNYHTHGPDQAYCVSVCAAGKPLIGQEPVLEELAHIRGIGEQREDCGPRMAAFAARLVERYALQQEPLVFLDGAPFAGA